jgi:hypothetical protein
MRRHNVPKEKIYDESAMYDVEIGWGQDRSVQVGITTHDGVPVIAKLAGIENLSPADLGRAGATPDSPAGFTGLWSTLDRAGINRLIKMLRKARDEAYGRDE